MQNNFSQNELRKLFSKNGCRCLANTDAFNPRWNENVLYDYVKANICWFQIYRVYVMPLQLERAVPFSRQKEKKTRDCVPCDSGKEFTLFQSILAWTIYYLNTDTFLSLYIHVSKCRFPCRLHNF